MTDEWALVNVVAVACGVGSLLLSGKWHPTHEVNYVYNTIHDTRRL
jgi:hypothetical protein